MKSMKKLLLISSSRTHEFPGYFQSCENEVKHFLSSSKVSKVLFIPYALKTHEAYLNDVKPIFNNFGFEIEGIHNHDSPRQAVNEAQAIFIGGGNTFLLLKSLYDHNLIEAIRKRVLHEGCPYIGVSAGTNVATRSIHTTNDMPIVYPPTFAALNLLSLNINPHYLDADPTSKHKGETRDTRILEYLHHSDEATFVLGLREGAFLNVTNDNIVLGGYNGAKLIRCKPTMDSSLSGLSSTQKDELMDQVKQQIAVANAQELLQKMTEKCFKKCINKPGTSLDNSEQKCIAMCMDRYMDSWNLVSRSYSQRLQRERNHM